MPEIQQQYQVLQRLQHDGATYQPGDRIALQDANAAYLLRKQSICKIEPAAKKSGKGGEV